MDDLPYALRLLTVSLVRGLFENPARSSPLS